jgi:hypothetical protein
MPLNILPRGSTAHNLGHTAGIGKNEVSEIWAFVPNYLCLFAVENPPYVVHLLAHPFSNRLNIPKYAQRFGTPDALLPALHSFLSKCIDIQASAQSCVKPNKVTCSHPHTLSTPLFLSNDTDQVVALNGRMRGLRSIPP